MSWGKQKKNTFKENKIIILFIKYQPDFWFTQQKKIVWKNFVDMLVFIQYKMFVYHLYLNVYVLFSWKFRSNEETKNTQTHCGVFEL